MEVQYPINYSLYYAKIALIFCFYLDNIFFIFHIDFTLFVTQKGIFLNVFILKEIN